MAPDRGKTVTKDGESVATLARIPVLVQFAQIAPLPEFQLPGTYGRDSDQSRASQHGLSSTGSRSHATRSSYASNSFTGVPVRSSSELAILIGRPMGLMYSRFQSMPSAW